MRHAARGRPSSEGPRDGHTDLPAAGEPLSQRDLQPSLGMARAPPDLLRDESPDASLLQKTNETMLNTRAAAGGGGTGRAGQRGHRRHTKASSSATLSSHLRRPKCEVRRSLSSSPSPPLPSFILAPALMELDGKPIWLKTNLPEKKQPFSAGSGILCHRKNQLWLMWSSTLDVTASFQ